MKIVSTFAQVLIHRKDIQYLMYFFIHYSVLRVRFYNKINK